MIGRERCQAARDIRHRAQRSHAIAIRQVNRRQIDGRPVDVAAVGHLRDLSDDIVASGLKAAAAVQRPLDTPFDFLVGPRTNAELFVSRLHVER